MSMTLYNCTCCHASYEPYKLGAESEIFGRWCELPAEVEKKGLCGFCNPKSKWYVDKKCHEKL